MASLKMNLFDLKCCFAEEKYWKLINGYIIVTFIAFQWNKFILTFITVNLTSRTR